MTYPFFLSGFAPLSRDCPFRREGPERAERNPRLVLRGYFPPNYQLSRDFSGFEAFTTLDDLHLIVGVNVVSLQL